MLNTQVIWYVSRKQPPNINWLIEPASHDLFYSFLPSFLFVFKFKFFALRDCTFVLQFVYCAHVFKNTTNLVIKHYTYEYTKQ